MLPKLPLNFPNNSPKCRFINRFALLRSICLTSIGRENKMTEFDSKKKLKEAKIDYTWYNQQIEQKLPLLYKFLGICYKLDVYGDDNLIKNECAKWGMTFADKFQCSDLKKSFADIRYSSQEQVSIFSQVLRLIKLYKKYFKKDGVLVTVNCCEGKMPNKIPILLTYKELLEFNPKTPINTLRTQLEEIDGAFGFISFEVKFNVILKKFIPHFHIVVLGVDKRVITNFFKKRYPEVHSFRVSRGDFCCAKGKSPMVYYHNQELKILDFRDIKKSPQNVASYICKFKTYQTNFYQQGLKLIPYAKGNKKRSSRPDDRVHNSHLLFLDKMRRSDVFSVFGKDAMTKFITKYKQQNSLLSTKIEQKKHSTDESASFFFEHNTYSKPLNSNKDVLKLFGFDKLRKEQKEPIKYIKENKACLVILATGSGKSFIFQAPALQMKGICIVITPLISLMNDQTRKLNKIHKDLAVTINREVKKSKRQKILQKLSKGKYKFLYVSPEMILNDENLQNVLNKLSVSMIVADEAHCIYYWGYDFRPCYDKIGEVLKMFPKAKFMALTATADKMTRKTIKSMTEDKLKVFKGKLDRPNIDYGVVEKEGDGTKQLMKILRPYIKNGKVTDRVIIYCNHVDMTEAVHNFLKDRGIDSLVCTGKTKEQMKTVLKPFHQMPCIVVATSAFGMGIDRKNVRCVVHFEMPCNLEFYYQESGRAGRDGKSAEAVMMVSKVDKEIAKREFCSKSDEKLKKFAMVENYIKLPKSKRRDYLIKAIS